MSSSNYPQITPYQTFESLFPLTGSELIALFNSITDGTPVKKFESFVAGRRRVWTRIEAIREEREPAGAAVEQANEDQLAMEEVDAIAEAAARAEVDEPEVLEEPKPTRRISGTERTVAKAMASRSRKGGLGFCLAPSKEQKEIRPTSKRARALELLQRPGGALLTEIMAACEWKRVDAYEGVRLINKSAGYGLWGEALEGGDYRIRVVETASEYSALVRSSAVAA